ncbi:MAG: hypothetical protein ACXWUG_29470 [Polyangiales bacterium]
MRLSSTARIALCALLPVVGIVELALAESQKRAVPTDAEWHDAAVAVRAMKAPNEMVIVAPRWAEPLGRKALGDVDKSLVELKMAGRSDLEAVPRVVELSIRNQDDPQTKGWKLVEERKFGHVKVRVLENPKPDKLVRDLIDEFGQDTPAVKLPVGPNGVPLPGVAPTETCRWETSASRMPDLFRGPPLPPTHFLCPPFDLAWSWVAPTVTTDLEYVPRRCIFLHPSDQATAITFPPRRIGHKVVAYMGLQALDERELNKPPVNARIEIAGKEVAVAKHKDGDGWLRFEGSTAEFAGQNHPVRIVTWADASPQFRVACVAAQLRD